MLINQVGDKNDSRSIEIQMQGRPRIYIEDIWVDSQGWEMQTAANTRISSFWANNWVLSSEEWKEENP